MYSVSTEFNTAAEAITRQILIKACFNGSIWLTGKNLIDITVTEALDSSSGISMGTTIASKLSLTFKMPETPILLTGGWVQPYVGFEGAAEYCPLGKYYITDISSKGDKITVTGYDGFSKTEEQYTPQIEMPNTAKTILNDIAAQCGFIIAPSEAPTVDEDGILESIELPTVDENGVLIFADTPAITQLGVVVLAGEAAYPEGTFDMYDFTCRQWIGYLAGLLGKNAKFNRDGELTFKWYKDIDYSITSELQYLSGFTKLTDDIFTVQSITAGASDNNFTAGNGVGISFENPFMTQERLDEIAATIGTPSFMPASIKWRGNPIIEAGDIIVADDKAGVSYTVYIMEQTLKIGGGLHSEIKCYGSTEEAINFETSPQKRKLQKIYSDLQKAIANATKLLNGANGGVFEILDEDHDGINDGWKIRSADDSRFIKATLDGIGITTDGGATYQEAMTVDGINASTITTGQMSAERITVGDKTLGDVFEVTLDADGHPVVIIGASNSNLHQKQTNDAISFVDNADQLKARFSTAGAEWADMQEIKYCGFVWTKSENGNVRFTKAGES